MPGPDTVAEEVPVFAYLALALALALQWAEMRGLRFIWKHTIGGILSWLSGQAIRIPHVTTVHPFGFAKTLNNDIENYFASQILAAEEAMGRAFHQAAHLQLWMVEETYGLGKDVFDWIDNFQNHWLRRYLKGALEAAVPAVLIASLIRKYVAAELPHLIKLGRSSVTHEIERVYRLPKSLNRRLTKDEAKIAALIAALAGLAGHISLPHPNAIPKVFGVPHWLYRWRNRVNRRLHKLEGLFGAAVMAAAMANVLGTTAKCLRSGNIGRAARRWCGLEKWLVDLFLLGTVEAFIATDLCGFTDLLIKQATVLRPALMELVDVEDALIGCHGTTKPISFDLPPAQVTPLQGASPLAA